MKTRQAKPPAEQRGNPLWNVIKSEWQFLGKRRKYYVLFMTLFLIAGVIGLFTPLIIGKIFNAIQGNITTEAELYSLIKTIFLLLAVTVGFWVFHGTARILEELTGFYVHRNYTNSKIKKVLGLPVWWHKDHHTGDTIDKVNRGRGSIETISTGMTYNILYAFVRMFGSLIILFFVNWKIASAVTVFSIVILTTIITIDRTLMKSYRELNKFSNKLSASIFDYLSNIFTVITLRLKKVVIKEVDHRIMASHKVNRRTVLLDEFKWGGASIIISLMTVIVLSYEAYTSFTTTGIIMAGTLYILYGYLNNVGRTFFDLASIYGRATRHSARLRGVQPIDDTYEKVENKNSGKLPKNWNTIEVKGLDFSYNKGEKTTHLEQVNLTLKRGQKIALIGESGSGKSTVLSLLRGLYEPAQVKVIVDGKQEEKGLLKIKRTTSLIPQDPEIFNNTIKYNIAMDLPTKKEDLHNVIRMAQFERVVKRLDKGLNTNVLEKGVSLSGGEKQRLALARGLLAAKNSDIVLLDEPTSSVDSLNEIKIHDNLFKEYKDKTIISSIHRLHLLNKFDYIYMFDKGKIIAQGTLKELKQHKPFRDILRKHAHDEE